MSLLEKVYTARSEIKISKQSYDIPSIVCCARLNALRLILPGGIAFGLALYNGANQERALIEQIKRDTNFDELATVFFGPEWKTPLSNSTDETAKRLQESQTPNVSMQQSNLKGQQNTPEQPQSKPEKSVVARFLGLLVGTEVNNSYALICRHCSAHNGLALAEDFPNLSQFDESK
ncbi:hypothetical protein Pelo_9197 [Pelomyxa schiedti]|nr:hypothetical protein Pelo_9197 [Pelomyxa schiedti]